MFDRKGHALHAVVYLLPLCAAATRKLKEQIYGSVHCIEQALAQLLTPGVTCQCGSNTGSAASQPAVDCCLPACGPHPYAGSMSIDHRQESTVDGRLPGAFSTCCLLRLPAARQSAASCAWRGVYHKHVSTRYAVQSSNYSSTMGRCQSGLEALRNSPAKLPLHMMHKA